MWNVLSQQETWISSKKPVAPFPMICIQGGTQGGTQDGTQGVTQDVTQGDTQDDTQGDTQGDSGHWEIEKQVKYG